jgi:hypothetical protein
MGAISDSAKPTRPRRLLVVWPRLMLAGAAAGCGSQPGAAEAVHLSSGSSSGAISSYGGVYTAVLPAGQRLLGSCGESLHADMAPTVAVHRGDSAISAGSISKEWSRPGEPPQRCGPAPEPNRAGRSPH